MNSERIRDAVLVSLEQDGVAYVVVHGRSMLPTLWPGAKVRVRSAVKESIRAGDIVLLNAPTHLVLHRFDGERFRGDSRSYFDPDEFEVVAKVEGIVLGRLQLSLGQKLDSHFIATSSRILPVWRSGIPILKMARSKLIRSRNVEIQQCHFDRLSSADQTRVLDFLRRRGLPYSRSVKDRLHDEMNHGVGAFHAGKLVGWVWCSAAGSIFDLFVLPSWRGIGIGKQLLRHAMRASASGFHAMVEVDNLTSARLFHRAGFLPIGRFENYIRYEFQIDEEIES